MQISLKTLAKKTCGQQSLKVKVRMRHTRRKIQEQMKKESAFLKSTQENIDQQLGAEKKISVQSIRTQHFLPMGAIASKRDKKCR